MKRSQCMTFNAPSTSTVCLHFLLVCISCWPSRTCRLLERVIEMQFSGRLTRGGSHTKTNATWATESGGSCWPSLVPYYVTVTIGKEKGGLLVVSHSLSKKPKKLKWSDNAAEDGAVYDCYSTYFLVNCQLLRANENYCTPKWGTQTQDCWMPPMWLSVSNSLSLNTDWRVMIRCADPNCIVEFSFSLVVNLEYPRLVERQHPLFFHI